MIRIKEPVDYIDLEAWIPSFNRFNPMTSQWNYLRHFRFSYRGYPRNEIDGPFNNFFTVCKYPPDASYILVTIGWNMLALRALPAVPQYLRTFLSVYGQAPLFFYMVHFTILSCWSTVYHIVKRQKFRGTLLDTLVIW